MGFFRRKKKAAAQLPAEVDYSPPGPPPSAVGTPAIASSSSSSPSPRKSPKSSSGSGGKSSKAAAAAAAAAAASNAPPLTNGIGTGASPKTSSSHKQYRSSQQQQQQQLQSTTYYQSQEGPVVAVKDPPPALKSPPPNSSTSQQQQQQQQQYLQQQQQQPQHYHPSYVPPAPPAPLATPSTGTASHPQTMASASTTETGHVTKPAAVAKDLVAAAGSPPPQQPSSSPSPAAAGQAAVLPTSVTNLVVGDPSLATPEVTRDLIKKFISDIWNRGALELIPQVCSPSLRFNGNVGMDRVGHDGFAHMVTTIRNALSDYHCEIHSMVVEGNKAFCRLRFTGRHTGELLGFGPTGKLVAWMGAAEFTCKNGRIMKVWELGDVKSLEEQLQGYE